MKIVDKVEGISLPIVLMSSALLLVITSMISVLVISEVGSFNRASKTKNAYALAKEGIQIAVANINNGKTQIQVNAIEGTTGESGPNDIYQVISWNQTSRALTVRGRAQVRNETDCRFDVDGDGRDEFFVCKNISTKLIEDPDTYKIKESYSTTNNRDTTVTGDQSVDWKTQAGYLELQQKLLAENVFQVDTAGWKYIIDIEEWNGRLWVVSRVGATAQIYSSGSGDPGSWQLEWQKPIQEGDFTPQDFEIYNGNLYLITGGKQQMNPYGDVYRKSSTENFAKIKIFSAQFQRFMPYHMEAFNGKLYIVGEGYSENTVVVYDGVSFTEEVRYPAGGNNNQLFATHSFDGNVYAGGHRDFKSSVIGSDGSGVGSWGVVGAPSDPKTNYINSMIEYNGYLYAGQYNASGTFARIWRTQDGTSWESAGQIPGTGSSRIPNVIASFETYNNKLLAGDGTSTSRGEKAIYQSTNGTDWSLYYDFSGGGSLKAMKVYNSCLYAGTLPDGIVYRICEQEGGGGLFVNGTAAGVINVPANNIREIRITVYPAAGSDGSLNNFQVSANGGAWQTDATTETFVNGPVTKTFTNMANGLTSNIRYRFDMITADGNETPLVDNVKIEYIAGEPFQIDYSTWRAD